MTFAFLALFLAGFFPMLALLPANRNTSLFHAVLWCWAAWWGWGLLDFFHDGAYLALCLTGAAVVAVLGARRPQVGPWNFVVIGFLGIMLLPLAEMWFLGSGNLGGVRLLFLAGTLTLGTANFLPTRFGLAAALLMLALTSVMLQLSFDAPPSLTLAARLGILLVPWLGWRLSRRASMPSTFDHVWLDFRDRFGFVWAQRVREQFNLACRNAAWPGMLEWSGLTGANAAHLEEMTVTLRKLLRRFTAVREEVN